VSPDQEHQSVDWSSGAPPELEEKLKRSLQATPREDGSEDISWTCPRCLKEHLSNLFRDEIWVGLDSVGRSGEIGLRCECGLPHLGRPDGEVGCGYRIVVAVAEEED
jgi:hypothetical protein